MKPYMRLSVDPGELLLFYSIKRVVQKMPDIELEEDERTKGKIISCHMLARALACFFPLKCKDGYFGTKPSREHSWFLTSSGLILDVYPIGLIGGPVLLDTRHMTLWESLYREKRIPEIFTPSFERNVSRVTEVVGETIKTLALS